MNDEFDDLLTGPDDLSASSADDAAMPAPEGAMPGGSDAAHSVATHVEEHESQPGSNPQPAGEPQSMIQAAASTESLVNGPLVNGPSDALSGSEPEAAEPAPKPSKPRPPRPPVEDLSGEEKQPIKKEWYILKVQSNREDSIAEALQRRIAIAGLGDYFDEIIVPTEKVSEFKSGKKRVVKRKIYPGYIVVHMELNDDTWFLVRETPGIGDFTGSGGKPTPMLPHDVNKIVARTEETAAEEIRTVIPFSPGDRVRIKEGTFENFEGDVENIDKANGRVTIMINIFGRSTPVELEYWQVEKL